MFVTFNQFFVFLACVAYGGISGILFSIVILIDKATKKKWVKIVLDIFAFLTTAVVYLIYSYKMQFPNLRMYMVAGVLLGIALYLKSFHIMLAKFLKKAYNIIKRKKAKG